MWQHGEVYEIHQVRDQHDEPGYVVVRRRSDGSVLAELDGRRHPTAEAAERALLELLDERHPLEDARKTRTRRSR